MAADPLSNTRPRPRIVTLADLPPLDATPAPQPAPTTAQPLTGGRPLSTEPRRDVPAHAAIRVIKADLAAIGEVLQTSGLNDETTNLLRLWHKNFLANVQRDGNAERAIQEFIPLAKKILIDPLPQMHNPQSAFLVDDNPLLGSDGRLYSRTSLTAFLSADGIRADRSPFAQNGTEAFTTKPHPVAAHMIQWLKRKNAYIAPAESAEIYRRLVRERRAAAIPSSQPPSADREGNIRRVLAQGPEERKESSVRHEERKENAEARVDSFAQDRERMAQIGEEIGQGLSELRENDTAELDGVDARADALERDIATLERQIQELDEILAKLQESTDEAERNNKQLERDIYEVDVQLKKREKQKAKGLALNIALVTASIIATLIIKKYLPFASINFFVTR